MFNSCKNHVKLSAFPYTSIVKLIIIQLFQILVWFFRGSLDLAQLFEVTNMSEHDSATIVCSTVSHALSLSLYVFMVRTFLTQKLISKSAWYFQRSRRSLCSTSKHISQRYWNQRLSLSNLLDLSKVRELREFCDAGKLACSTVSHALSAKPWNLWVYPNKWSRYSPWAS